MRQTPHKVVKESHTIDKERISKTSETCNTQHAEFSRQTLETLQLSHQADNEELSGGEKHSPKLENSETATRRSCTQKYTQ